MITFVLFGKDQLFSFVCYYQLDAKILCYNVYALICHFNLCFFALGDLILRNWRCVSDSVGFN